MVLNVYMEGAAARFRLGKIDHPKKLWSYHFLFPTLHSYRNPCALGLFLNIDNRCGRVAKFFDGTRTKLMAADYFTRRPSARMRVLPAYC